MNEWMSKQIKEKTVTLLTYLIRILNRFLPELKSVFTWEISMNEITEAI